MGVKKGLGLRESDEGIRNGVDQVETGLNWVGWNVVTAISRSCFLARSEAIKERIKSRLSRLVTLECSLLKCDSQILTLDLSL